jgi:hypothetical protein
MPLLEAPPPMPPDTASTHFIVLAAHSIPENHHPPRRIRTRAKKLEAVRCEATAVYFPELHCAAIGKSLCPNPFLRLSGGHLQTIQTPVSWLLSMALVSLVLLRADSTSHSRAGSRESSRAYSMASPKADSIAVVPLVGSNAVQKVVLKALPRADWMASPLFYHIWQMQRKKVRYSLFTILHKAARNRGVRFRTEYSLVLILLVVREGDLIGRRILLGIFVFLLEVLQIVFGKRGLSSNSCNWLECCTACSFFLTSRA